MSNPLSAYPDRNWEQVYRDQYRYDSSFTYVCSPKDTDACRMRHLFKLELIPVYWETDGEKL